MSKVVVITGASAGVGRALAREFARHGARIGLLARDLDRLKAAQGEVAVLGGEAVVCVCDVAEHEQVERAAAEIERAFGPIDIWINNAMVSVFSPVKEMQADEYRRVTEVTYLGAVHGTLAALRRMLPRNRGSIVQVGSALAYRSIPLQSAYCAAKHALKGFTESLRTELMHDRSRVHLAEVHLPAMNTPQFSWVKSRLPNHPQPVPPIYQPEVAARAIYWAVQRRKREVWVGSPTVQAIVGDRVAPALLDRYLANAGYEAQQTKQPVAPDRANNLYGTLRGDFAAHGEFDDRAKPYSMQFWLSKNRYALLASFGILAGAAAWLLSRGEAPQIPESKQAA